MAMFTARRMARSRWCSPPGVTGTDHVPLGDCASAPARSCELNIDLRVAAADDGLELGRAFDAPEGATNEIERAKDDVLGADGDGRRVGQHASDLAPGVASENPGLGRGIIDEEHAAVREKTTKMRDLRVGERSDRPVSDEVGERLGKERVVIGAHR